MWNNDEMQTVTAEYADEAQPVSMIKLQPGELGERALALQN
jgi:hypothetical protein|tara:strand:- start:138 stop:260 length:123 start_codon:yes stop_codon:yes gene_type:complete